MNPKKPTRQFTNLIIGLALIFSLTIPARVLAEGETPGTADTPVESPSVSESSEAPAASSDAAPADPAAQVAESSDQAPDAAGVIEAARDNGLDVAVVNSDGVEVPLASQEAAVILADPQFCWEDTSTAVVNCGASRVTLDEALTDAYTHSFSATEKGIIIFEAGTFAGGQTVDPANWGANTAPSALEFRGAAPSATIITGGLTFSSFSDVALNLNNLTVRDGLAFDANNNTTITLKDLILQNSAGSGLMISNQTGSGAVSLTGVTSSGNSDSGADIQVEGSSAAVMITDSKFSNNGSYGLYVTANNQVTLSNIEALNNGSYSLVDTDSGAGYGIVVANSSFSNSIGDGLRLYSGGGATVSNTTFAGNSGSGLDVWSNLNTSIFCSIASNNGAYGVSTGAMDTNYLLGLAGSGNLSGLFDVTSGDLDYQADYCCSGPCPVDSEEDASLEDTFSGVAVLNDLIIPVYIGTSGGIGTLPGDRNLVFQLLKKNAAGAEDLLAEVRMPAFSALSGTTFGLKPLETEAFFPLPFASSGQLIPPGFMLDVFGAARNTLYYLEGYMEIKFFLPQGFVLPAGRMLTVQYYDDSAGQWQVVPSSRVGNAVIAYSDLIGSYALVMVPTQ